MVTSKGKIFAVLIIALLVVNIILLRQTFFILPNKINIAQTQNEKPQPANKVKALLEQPIIYFARVIQVGGVGSDLYTKYAWEAEGKYLDKNDFASVSLNNINDILYLDCKEGYKPVSADSPTNQTFKSTTGNGFGIELKDQIKNELTVKCEKLN